MASVFQYKEYLPNIHPCLFGQALEGLYTLMYKAVPGDVIGEAILPRETFLLRD